MTTYYNTIATNLQYLLRDGGWKPSQKGRDGAQYLDQWGWWEPVDDLSLKGIFDQLANKLGDKDSEIEELQTENSEEKEGLQSDLTEAETDYAALFDKNEKLQSTIEALEAKVKELEEGRNTGEPSNKEQVEGRAQRTITPPKSGATKTVWDVADYLTTTKIPTRTELVEVVKQNHPDIKEATTAAAYSNWAKYNGIDPKTAKKVEGGVSAYAFVVGPSSVLTEEVVWKTPPALSTFIPPPPLPIIPPPPLPNSNNPY